MISCQLQDPIPVKIPVRSEDDVSDIRPIEAFATGHKEFRRKQFFRRQHPALHTANIRGMGVPNPRVIDCNDSIAHPGNQVNEVAVAMNFRQPDRIAYLALKAASFKRYESSLGYIRTQEDIQVFSEATNSRVLPKGESSSHRIGETCFLKQGEDLAKKGLLLLREGKRGGGSHFYFTCWCGFSCFFFHSEKALLIDAQQHERTALQLDITLL